MPRLHRSPLSNDDLNTLEALAKKANAHGLSNGYAPLYVAIDAGDAKQTEAYLLLCWPALDHRAAACARLIFDHVFAVARDVFGAEMVVSEAEGAPRAART